MTRRIRFKYSKNIRDVETGEPVISRDCSCRSCVRRSLKGVPLPDRFTKGRKVHIPWTHRTAVRSKLARYTQKICPNELNPPCIFLPPHLGLRKNCTRNDSEARKSLTIFRQSSDYKQQATGAREWAKASRDLSFKSFLISSSGLWSTWVDPRGGPSRTPFCNRTWGCRPELVRP